MTKATYFVKPGAWDASSYPLRASNTAYSLNTVVREPGSKHVIRCTGAGTTDTNAYTVPSSNPENDVAVGTSYWSLVTGKGGVVANAWDIANETIYQVINISSTQLNQGWYYGRVHNASNGDSSVIYLASNSSYPGAALQNNKLCAAAYTSQSYSITSNNYYRLIGFPAGMPYELSVISADETVPASTHGTFKAGATFNLEAGTSYSYLAGKNYLKGIVINAPSAQFRISYYIPDLGTRAIQFAAVNHLDQCTINLTTDAGFPDVPATLKIAATLQPGNAKDRLPIMPQGFNSSTALGEVMRTTLSKATINVNHGGAYIDISSDTEIYDSIIDVTSCAPSGLLVFGENEEAGDIEVRMTGVTISGSVPKLIADRCTGRVVVTMEGCTLPGSDMDALFWSLPPRSIHTITFHIIDSGASGGITPESYRYYTNRVKSIKTDGVYRSGSLSDAVGTHHSYFVQTQDAGLSPLVAFDELPHLSRPVTTGDYELRLLVCVPPDQLLYDDELFAQFIGPDIGTVDGEDPWSSLSPYTDGAYAANTAWARRVSLREDRKLYPVVASIWVGTPVGWVTQALSVYLPIPASGRVHCIPMVAKTGAQFILCPTIDLLQVA